MAFTPCYSVAHCSHRRGVIAGRLTNVIAEAYLGKFSEKIGSLRVIKSRNAWVTAEGSDQVFVRVNGFRAKFVRDDSVHFYIVDDMPKWRDTLLKVWDVDRIKDEVADKGCNITCCHKYGPVIQQCTL